MFMTLFKNESLTSVNLKSILKNQVEWWSGGHTMKRGENIGNINGI